MTAPAADPALVLGPNGAGPTAALPSATPVSVPLPSDNASPAAPVPPVLVVAVPAAPPANAAELRKDSRLTLERFLSAATIEERLTVSQNAKKVRPLMEQHYRERPFVAPQVEEIAFLTEGEMGESKHPFHLYNVLLKDEMAPIPVAVEKTKDGYRVDWETYAESYTHRLATFFAKPREEPGRFRVVLKRAHYFGPAVPGQGTDRIAYTVESPMREEAFPIWVDKDSNIYREKLASDGRAGWDIESFIIAELAWRGDDARGRWVSLRGIPSESWRTE